MVRGLVRVCKYERVNEVDLVLKQKDAGLTKENGLVDSKDVMEYVAAQLQDGELARGALCLHPARDDAGTCYRYSDACGRWLLAPCCTRRVR